VVRSVKSHIESWGYSSEVERVLSMRPEFNYKKHTHTHTHTHTHRLLTQELDFSDTRKKSKKETKKKSKKEMIKIRGDQ
jgi:hypothetical protein